MLYTVAMHLRATLLALAAFALFAASSDDGYWANWRGPKSSGYAPSARNLPVKWSETENILWKVKTPSWSAATPIIWGDSVLLITAEQGFVNPTYDTKQLRRAPEDKSDKIFIMALNRK